MLCTKNTVRICTTSSPAPNSVSVIISFLVVFRCQLLFIQKEVHHFECGLIPVDVELITNQLRSHNMAGANGDSINTASSPWALPSASSARLSNEFFFFLILNPAPKLAGHGDLLDGGGRGGGPSGGLSSSSAVAAAVVAESSGRLKPANWSAMSNKGGTGMIANTRKDKWLCRCVLSGGSQ